VTRPADHRGPAVALGTGAGRAARGAVSGTACVALSLSWHVAGGAPVPGLGAVLLSVVVAAAVCTWWADRRRGPVALVLLTAALQAGLHVLFGAVAGHGAGLVPGPAMTAAHVLAAVGVAWLLARGEDAVWELCGALTHAWAPRRPAPLVPADTDAPVRWWPGADLAPRRVLFARSLPRRGPPALPVV
jgi:hypothetical protein